MYLTSPYPSIPVPPEENVHELIFNSPTANVPDYVAQIDVVSGRKRTRKEVQERVRDAATALGTPASQGGLGLSGEAGDIVGICSGNCMVSMLWPMSMFAYYILTSIPGLHHAHPSMYGYHDSVRSDILFLYTHGIGACFKAVDLYLCLRAPELAISDALRSTGGRPI